MAKQVYYSGQVQGVGFRATAASIARRHPGVRGWVRNLSDGRVELFADGNAEVVEAFLADLREYMAEYIQGEDTFDREGDESLTGFRVRH
jgi:acylphosphatase